MSGSSSRYQIWNIGLLLILAAPCYGQNIKIEDVITGRFSAIQDFQVNDEGERFYILTSARDSFLINDNWVDLRPDEDSYFVGINHDGNLNFLIDGWGSNLLALDSSVFFIRILAQDTMFVADTFFVNEGAANSYNMVALEYDFQGNYIRGKHWPSQFDCRSRVVDICAMDDRFYLTGTYRRDTLQLDSYKIGLFDQEDIFVAELDESLECQWLTRMGSYDIASPHSIDANSAREVLTAGFFYYGYFLFCEDTIIDPYGGENVYVSVHDSAGNCEGMEIIRGKGHQVVWSAKYLSDASIVVAGYHSDTTEIGDTVLVGPHLLIKGFVAKYNQMGDLAFAFQFDGDETHFAVDMVVTDDDHIWVGGGFFSDTFRIGDIELYSRSSGKSDVFVAKIDQYGNVLFAESFGGTDFDRFIKLETGPDNSVYAMMDTRSDTVFIGDEQLVLNQEYYNNNIVIISIDGTTTSLITPDPITPSILIYPNPVSAGDQIVIDFDKSQVPNIQNITLHNLNGQVVTTYIVNGDLPQTLQVPNVNSGIYILNFDFGSYQISEKIVIVR